MRHIAELRSPGKCFQIVFLAENYIALVPAFILLNITTGQIKYLLRLWGIVT